MDKKKTGNLIKESRTRKNYTQSELGDLLGVSNKAVSRWENGESFPDVGILENLASVLDIRIQDIITGDTEVNDESVVAEVVRVARLQQKDKKRKLIRNSLLIIAMLCGFISGLGSSNLFFESDSILVYVILMLLSYALILMGSISQNEAYRKDISKYGKCMKIVALVSLVWSILITWGVFLMVINGHIPFGMQLSSIGPFLNWQLIILFTLNLVIITIEIYRYERYNKTIHWGWFISIASMYLMVLYGDLLHRMSSFQGVIESLVIRTVITLIIAGIALVIAKLLNKK